MRVWTVKVLPTYVMSTYATRRPTVTDSTPGPVTSSDRSSTRAGWEPAPPNRRTYAEPGYGSTSSTGAKRRRTTEPPYRRTRRRRLHIATDRIRTSSVVKYRTPSSCLRSQPCTLIYCIYLYWRNKLPFLSAQCGQQSPTYLYFISDIFVYKNLRIPIK